MSEFHNTILCYSNTIWSYVESFVTSYCIDIADFSNLKFTRINIIGIKFTCPKKLWQKERNGTDE